MSTAFTAFPWAVTGGISTRTAPARGFDHGICARDFGAIGDGFTHPLSGVFATLAAAQAVYPLATALTQEFDEVAIQAAISYAYNNRVSLVELGYGNFKTTGPIFQDADGNLSVNVNAPTKFSFSLAVRGAGGVNGDGWGTRITPATNDYVVWWIGPGQGNRLSGVNIMAAQIDLSRAHLPTTGCGIAISGGSGGASRTYVEYCWVQHLHMGFAVGHNVDALADSNFFLGCNADDCYYGYNFQQTQNYINTMVHCNAGNCKYAVYSVLGKAVNIYGGNLSAVHLLSAKFTIGTVTTLTVTAWNNITFDVTVSSPDVYLGYGDYDAFCLKTTNFGLIPLLYVSYNSGTDVLRLKIDPNWTDAEFGYGVDISTTTAIQADIQACTTLYCAERAFTCVGVGIHIYGVHLENPVSLTTFIVSGAGFAGDTICTVENLYCNYSPAGDQWKNDASLDQLYYLQQCFPFIESEDVPIVLRGCNFADSTYGFLIRANANQVIRIENAGNLGSPKTQVYGNYPDLMDSNVLQTRGRGAGKYDTNYFFSADNAGGGSVGTNRQWKTNSLGQAPYWGYFPEPGCNPIITSTQLSALTSSPGTIGTYVAICGGIPYRVWDPITSVDSSSKLFAVSSHYGITYGQNLTSTTWTYKGGSNCLYISSDKIGLMQEGLVVSPNNTDWYVIRGVFRDNLNYVTACHWANDQVPYLAGASSTVLSSGTLYQQPFAITRY